MMATMLLQVMGDFLDVGVGGIACSSDVAAHLIRQLQNWYNGVFAVEAQAASGQTNLPWMPLSPTKAKGYIQWGTTLRFAVGAMSSCYSALTCDDCPGYVSLFVTAWVVRLKKLPLKRRLGALDSELGRVNRMLLRRMQTRLVHAMHWTH